MRKRAGQKIQRRHGWTGKGPYPEAHGVHLSELLFIFLEVGCACLDGSGHFRVHEIQVALQGLCYLVLSGLPRILYRVVVKLCEARQNIIFVVLQIFGRLGRSSPVGSCVAHKVSDGSLEDKQWLGALCSHYKDKGKECLGIWCSRYKYKDKE